MSDILYICFFFALSKAEFGILSAVYAGLLLIFNYLIIAFSRPYF